MWQYSLIVSKPKQGKLSSGGCHLNSNCRLQDLGGWVSVVAQIKKMGDICVALNVALWLAIVVILSKAEWSWSWFLVGETQELLCEMRPYSSDYENYCLVVWCTM